MNLVQLRELKFGRIAFLFYNGVLKIWSRHLNKFVKEEKLEKDFTDTRSVKSIQSTNRTQTSNMLSILSEMFKSVREERFRDFVVKEDGSFIVLTSEALCFYDEYLELMAKIGVDANKISFIKGNDIYLVNQFSRVITGKGSETIIVDKNKKVTRQLGSTCFLKPNQEILEIPYGYEKAIELVDGTIIGKEIFEMEDIDLLSFELLKDNRVIFVYTYKFVIYSPTMDFVYQTTEDIISHFVILRDGNIMTYGQNKTTPTIHRILPLPSCVKSKGCDIRFLFA
jgi:hypothetical protein